MIGTATGLACAEFSGLGRGYDGFTPRYVRAVVLAVVANIAYQAGVYLFSFVGSATLGVLLEHRVGPAASWASSSCGCGWCCTPA